MRQLGPIARVLVVIAAGGVVVVVALGVLDVATGGDDASRATSSSLSRDARGLAGYAELLRRYDHPVATQRDTLSNHVPSTAATLVVLDPPLIDSATVRALRAFVHDGGRLIAGGADSTRWVQALTHDTTRWSTAGVFDSTPVDDTAAVSGVRVVHSAGDGSWTNAQNPLLEGHTGGVLLADARIGGGVVFLLADASPLQNRLLARADNAALGLRLAGTDHRPVVFAEAFHGASRGTGLGAIPERWKIAIVGTLLALLLTVVAAGRHLGPPEDAERELAPVRRAYVDAMGVALARTRAPARALAPLQASAREKLAERTGLPLDAEPDDLRAAAARLGWPEDEIDSLFAPIGDDDHALVAGRALARAMRGET